MGSNAIYIGASGMRLQSNKIDMLGNNIANSTSIAYKAGQVSFIDTYRGYEGQFANGNVKNVGNGVKVGNIFSDWTDGSVKETGQAGNLAWNGDGFFYVAKDGNSYYTRAGEFSLVPNPSGSGYVLMRPDGSMLQGTDDGGTTYGTILFSAFPTSWAVANDGTITAVGATITNAQIGAARFTNRDGLIREDNGLYSSTTGAGITLGVPASSGFGEVVQGALEMSNVDLVNEFTELVITQRAYQANSKTITTASEMLQEVLNLKR
ncbi:MAG: flagellar hook-basal body protein [Lentisphaerae bacterium]|nr:MAG: flagellar hook-basal body protein [Lentisphaerota bacterium]